MGDYTRGLLARLAPGTHRRREGYRPNRAPRANLQQAAEGAPTGGCSLDRLDHPLVHLEALAPMAENNQDQQAHHRHRQAASPMEDCTPDQQARPGPESHHRREDCRPSLALQANPQQAVAALPTEENNQDQRDRSEVVHQLGSRSQDQPATAPKVGNSQDQPGHSAAEAGTAAVGRVGRCQDMDRRRLA